VAEWRLQHAPDNGRIRNPTGLADSLSEELRKLATAIGEGLDSRLCLVKGLPDPSREPKVYETVAIDAIPRFIQNTHGKAPSFERDHRQAFPAVDARVSNLRGRNHAVVTRASSTSFRSTPSRRTATRLNDSPSGTFSHSLAARSGPLLQSARSTDAASPVHSDAASTQ
jgi:hypothetical protein